MYSTHHLYYARVSGLFQSQEPWSWRFGATNPELWEEFRLDREADEYDLYMQDWADEEAQGTELDLDRPPELSEAAVADIPRTTLSGLEAQDPELHRDVIVELQAMRDRDPRDPESPLMSEPEADDQPGSHGPGASSGASSMPRTAQGRNQGHQVVDLTMLHWLDVMFHTSLILLELIISQ